MSVSLGIAVGAERIRAVVLRSGRIAAATEAEVRPGEPLERAVAELVAAAPLPRFPRPRVVVALGPAHAQTRRLSGLPALDDPRLLAQVVREGAGKFFLGNGTPLATTGVRPVAPGTAWAAALDERVVRQVEAGCRTAGVRVERFVPAVAVLGRGLAAGTVLWPDGDAVAEVRLRDGELEGVRRLAAAAAPAGTAPEVLPPLARLGEQGWRFADAYGAAALPGWEPMVLRPGGGAEPPLPAWRLAVPAAALAAALLFAAAAPGLRALAAEEEAMGRVAALREQRRAAAEVERELERVSAALGEAAAFGANGYSPTLLLADLTAALPAGSALVAFRADTAGGSLVALAPRAAAVVQPLEGVPGIVSPEIVGPVTRETSAGRPVERVGIRFRIDPAARAALAADTAEAP
jgi:hypothetical protein